MGLIPGGTRANQKSYEPLVEYSTEITAVDRILLNDAQTSGGLLIFVPQDRKDRLVSALRKENITAAHIGDILGAPAQFAKRIFVEP